MVRAAADRDSGHGRSAVGRAFLRRRGRASERFRRERWDLIHVRRRSCLRRCPLPSGRCRSRRRGRCRCRRRLRRRRACLRQRAKERESRCRRWLAVRLWGRAGSRSPRRRWCRCRPPWRRDRSANFHGRTQACALASETGTAGRGASADRWRRGNNVVCEQRTAGSSGTAGGIAGASACAGERGWRRNDAGQADLRRGRRCERARAGSAGCSRGRWRRDHVAAQ